MKWSKDVKNKERLRICPNCIHYSKNPELPDDSRFSVCNRTNIFTSITKERNMGCDFNLKGWE